LILHLFENRAHFAAFREALFDDGEKWDEEHEPGAYTTGDDIWEHEYPTWRNVLGIGTAKVVRHEAGLHKAYRVGNQGHHRFLRCSLLGLCTAAGHGVRLIDGHVHKPMLPYADELLAKAREASADAWGVRHAFIDVPNSAFAKTSN